MKTTLLRLFTLFFLASLLLSACAPKSDPTARFAVNIDPNTESAVICVYHNHILLRFLPDGGYVKVDEAYVRVYNKRGESFDVITDQGKTYQTELFSAVPSGDGYVVTGDSYNSVDFLDKITVDTGSVCYSVGPDLNK